MKIRLNHFAVALTLLTIVSQTLIFFVYEPVTGQKPGTLVSVFPAYFLLINLILHYFLLKSAGKSPQSFVRTFMGMTTAKMMISLIFIVVIVFSLKPDFKAPAITFALLYLLFMVLEVVFIVKDLNRLKNNS